MAMAVALWGVAISAVRAGAGDAFQEAADAFDRRDWKSAASGFEAYLAKATDPELAAEAHFFLGESLAQQGRSTSARPQFQQYLAQRPTGRLSRAARFRAAEAAYLVRLDEPAASELAGFLKDYPGDALAALAASMRVVAEARLSRWPSARERYEALRRDHPGRAAVAKAAEQLAALALAGGQHRWAEQLYRQQAAAETPQAKVAALLGVGRAQSQTQRWADAAESYAQAIALASTQTNAAFLAAEALYAQGVCLEKLNRLDPALAAFDDAVAAGANEPVQADALLASALLRVQLRQIPAALSCFEKLAAEHPSAAQTAIALDGMARACSAAGREDEALRLLGRLCQSHSDSPLWPAAALRVAEHSCRKSQYAEAQTLVTRLLAASSARSVRPDALALAGQLAAAQSQWAASRAAYEQILAEFPKCTWKAVATYGVADTWFRQGDYSAAIDALLPLVECPSPESAAVVRAAKLRLAQAYGHRRQWNDALATAAAVDAASLDAEQRCEFDYLRGRCLAAIGDYAKARQSYAASLNSPQTPPSLAVSAQMMLAETYFVENDFEAALREYLCVEKLQATQSQRAAALLQAGKCCERLARPDRAAGLYARLATNYSQTTYAQEAISRRGALGEPRSLR